MNAIKQCALIGLFTLFGMGAAAAYEWQAVDTVDRYFPQPGSLLIHMNGTMGNPAGCANGYYYAITDSHVNYAEFKRMAQTAIASGKGLRIAVEDTAGNCYGSYPLVNMMYMQD